MFETNKVVGKVPYRGGGGLVISPDGRMVFSLGPQGGTVFEAEGEDRMVKVIGDDSSHVVAFDPSAKHLAIASGSGDAKVFETSGDDHPKLFGQADLLQREKPSH